jgi:membrane protease YdiL (CAAX protease family)
MKTRAWILVFACALFSVAHLSLLVGLRIHATRAHFDPPPGWRTLWAYLGYSDARDKIASLETVRAIAPGEPIAFAAADEEGIFLQVIGRHDLAARVAEHELRRSPWPKGRPAGFLALAALEELKNLGCTDRERQLAVHAAAELEWPSFQELAVVLLSRAGEHEDALRQFEIRRRASSPTKISRETLLAAALSQRALGHAETAAALEHEAVGARSHPGLVRPARAPPRASAVAPVWTDALAAATVDPEAPRAHWDSVARASARFVGAALILPLALGLLAWAKRPESGASPARGLAGATVLIGAYVLAAPACALIGGLNGSDDGIVGLAGAAPYLAAPFAGTRALFFWSSLLMTLVFVALALPSVEGLSLRELGWRPGSAPLRQVLVGLGLGLIVKAYALRQIFLPAQPSQAWLPPLLVGSLLFSAYVAFMEETLHRGYMMGALLRLPVGFGLANLGQAVVFTAIHVLVYHAERPSVGNMGLWLLLGLVFGWLTRRSQSLWPAFACHATVDLIAFFVLVRPQYDMLSMALAL